MSYVANYSGVFILLAISCLGRVSGFKYTDCACGIPGNTKDRIVYGVDAIPHEFPWLVAVLYRNIHLCGGSLISFQYVLTARHCVKIDDLSGYTIGIQQHRRDSSDGIRVGISNIIRHEEYDISLIKLQKPVKYSKILSPICFPNPDSHDYEQLAVVAGWGQLEPGMVYPEILQKIYMNIITHEECAETNSEEVLTEYYICAKADNGSTQVGDSGGPLMYEFEPGKWEIVGVVSLGPESWPDEIAGVFMKVTYFLNWIDTMTPDAIYCIS